MNEIVSADFFTVPTARLRVLFVFLVLEHRRREVLHVERVRYGRMDDIEFRIRQPGADGEIFEEAFDRHLVQEEGA